MLTACSCPFLPRPLCLPPAPARSCPLCPALSAPALPCRLLPCPLCPFLPALPGPVRPRAAGAAAGAARLPRQERRAETRRARPGSSGDGHGFVRVPKAPTRDQTRTSSECLCARRRRDRAGDQGLQKSLFPFPLQVWVTLVEVLLLYPENRELSCSLGLYIY